MKSSFLLVFILFVLLVLILAFIITNALSRRKLLVGGRAKNTKNIEDTKDTNNIENIETANNIENIETQKNLKYYYSIYNGDVGLVYDELKKLLSKYNFHETPLTKHVHVSIGSASGVDIDGKVNFKGHMVNGKIQYWDPLFTNQRAVIKNTLGGHKLLSEKIKLYETIKKLLPIGIKHIPKTYTIVEFETEILNKLPVKNKVYVLKKNNISKQKGVRVFSEKHEYFSIKKELNIKPHNAVIMEYITNPALTVDGKKFHLRICVLLLIESGIKRCYIHDEYRILTAIDKYVKGDWLNKNIHISCASNTKREYKYPNDIATSINETKFNEFKKTLAFSIAFNNSIIFEENDIGYHIYGVDVLVTDDENFFILEFNGHMLGHNAPNGIKGTKEGDLYRARYSRDYFSFILNSAVLPIFGIKKRPIPIAEVCSYGILSPFFNILTGDNRYVLIPYLDASPQEIETARKIYFHNKYITLVELLKICNLDNVFLLSGGTKQSLEKQPLRSESDAYASASDVYANDSDAYASGYLALDHNNYLTVVVTEEYQNRGIATAMIAQFLDIYAHRHFASNDKIYMIKKNAFIDKIALKLNFTLNPKGDTYSRPCHIHDISIKKVNSHKLLIYQFIVDTHNGFNYEFLLSDLNKNMVKTNSQFVHLAYGESGSHNSLQVIKSSTGSKYDKNFVIQGSELKSTLNVNIKTISIYQNYYENNDNIKSRNYDQYRPYLYNGYRIDLHLIFILYISNNGVKKCYYLKDNIMVACSNILFEDEIKNKLLDNTSYKIYIKKEDANYTWPDTFIPSNYEMQNELNLYIEEIANSIIQSDAISYPESNSGFSVFNATIDFIYKDNKYVPQFRNIYTHIGLSGYNNKSFQDAFSHKYYNFLTANIINPHFGLSDNTVQFVQPLKCIVNTELHVDADIISKLHLTFNKNRDKIEIHLYHDNSKIDKIGKIDLNIDNIDVIVLSHIELDSPYRKKNIAVNVIFVLMEILASYYAPLNISLKMAFVKSMFQIAHTLQFHKGHFIPDTKSGQKNESKKEEEYFIRLCRI